MWMSTIRKIIMQSVAISRRSDTLQCRTPSTKEERMFWYLSAFFVLLALIVKVAPEDTKQRVLERNPEMTRGDIELKAWKYLIYAWILLGFHVVLTMSSGR